MDLGLQGRVVLITGGSRGIGKGMARAFAEEGARLVLCARTEGPLQDTARELEKLGAETFAVTADITDKSQAQSVLQAAIGTFGRVDVLVNNVGGNRRNLFVDTTDEDWEEIMNMNFLAHVRMSRAAARQMQKNGAGAIIFIASIFGREGGGPTLSIYNATKSAMISLAKIMAMELAGQNIRVNSVAPGSIRFPGGSWDKRVQSDPEGMAEFIKQNIPLGRFGTAEEVANVVLFLASEKSSLINGACINVDGGQSKSLI
jgi:3-oxoacyl-[acyl-carrier protein] reductase